VEVEGTHVDAAEIVEGVEEDVELEVLVRGETALQERVSPVERPAIELRQPLDRDRITRRVEVVEVGEQEARGVADAPVRLDEAAEDLLRNAHLFPVVGGGDPEPQPLG